MRGKLLLYVLCRETGEIIGRVAARPGLRTARGVVLRVGVGELVVADRPEVSAAYRETLPCVSEEEARRWGFTNDSPLTSAVAV